MDPMDHSGHDHSAHAHAMEGHDGHHMPGMDGPAKCSMNVSVPLLNI